MPPVLRELSVTTVTRSGAVFKRRGEDKDASGVRGLSTIIGEFTGMLLIKKYHEHCMFCDSEKDLVEHKYKKQDEKDGERKVYICKECLSDITELK